MRGAGHADVLFILQVPGNKADEVPCECLPIKDPLMSEKQDAHEAPDIHPFSRVIAEMLTDWIEGCLNDHIVYPEDGLDDEAYMAQRKYALDDAEYKETDVDVYEKGDSKLNGLPERLSGVLLCGDSKSGKPIGSVSVKMQFSYDLDDTVTIPKK